MTLGIIWEKGSRSNVGRFSRKQSIITYRLENILQTVVATVRSQSYGRRVSPVDMAETRRPNDRMDMGMYRNNNVHLDASTTCIIDLRRTL